MKLESHGQNRKSFCTRKLQAGIIECIGEEGAAISSAKGHQTTPEPALSLHTHTKGLALHSVRASGIICKYVRNGKYMEGQ